LDANLRQPWPNTEAIQDLAPQKCKFSLSLACFADVAKYWKNQLLKTNPSNILKFMERLRIFFRVVK
jgi:hypothetical protein